MDRDGNFNTLQARLLTLAARARILTASIALSFVVVSSASAATDIQGTADDLRLKAENASIVEILNALSSRFGLKFKAGLPSPRLLSGLYSGTLRQTLARILDGHDYILEFSDRGLELVILRVSAEPQAGSSKTAAASTPVPAPTRPNAPTTAAAPAAPVATLASSSPAAPSVPPLSSFAVVPPVTP